MPPSEYAMYAERTGIIVQIPAIPMVSRLFINGSVTCIPDAPAVPVARENARNTPPITTMGIKYETPVLNALSRSLPIVLNIASPFRTITCPNRYIAISRSIISTG